MLESKGPTPRFLTGRKNNSLYFYLFLYSYFLILSFIMFKLCLHCWHPQAKFIKGKLQPEKSYCYKCNKETNKSKKIGSRGLGVTVV
jgi:hypothetical protein